MKWQLDKQTKKTSSLTALEFARMDIAFISPLGSLGIT